MENVNNLKAQFESFLKDHEKFVKGNASAGTRSRKALAEMAKLCKAIRAEISGEKNARKETKE